MHVAAQIDAEMFHVKMQSFLPNTFFAHVHWRRVPGFEWRMVDAIPSFLMVIFLTILDDRV